MAGSLFAASARQVPLAERMRPRSLDDVVGQQRVIGPGSMLRSLLAQGKLVSCIFWGPPGCGKTTVARLLAGEIGYSFVQLSATSSGVKDVRNAAQKAGENLAIGGRPTVLFLDEIHRFTKSQQDALLPCVEAGTLILIGATTQNPSFEVIAPLRSRARVVVFQPLESEHLRSVIERAMADRERGLGELELTLSAEACDCLLVAAAGDGRASLNVLEAACLCASHDGAQELTAKHVEQAAMRTAPAYDKDGEHHFNVVSALHKSIRGSDPDAALYWLARMVEGGEDPLYIARRLVRIATEDIGLADPQALVQACAAVQAVQVVGLPEANLALAQACVYLATTAKSNALEVAYGEAVADVRQRPSYPVPLHLRNAPTALMSQLGHGRDYVSAHAQPDAIGTQVNLPDPLAARTYYRPTERGVEARFQQRLAEIRSRRDHGPSAR